MKALILFFLYTTPPSYIDLPNGKRLQVQNYLHCIGPLDLAAAQARYAQKLAEYNSSKTPVADKPGMFHSDMSEPTLIKGDDPRFANLSKECRDH